LHERQGIPLPGPYAAYDFLYSKVHASGPGRAVMRLEISTAVADSQCAATAGLVAGIARAQAQVLSHLDRHFYGDVLRDVAAIEAALRKARVLAPGSVRQQP